MYSRASAFFAKIIGFDSKAAEKAFCLEHTKIQCNGLLSCSNFSESPFLNYAYLVENDTLGKKSVIEPVTLRIKD